MYTESYLLMKRLSQGWMPAPIHEEINAKYDTIIIKIYTTKIKIFIKSRRKKIIQIILTTSGENLGSIPPKDLRFASSLPKRLRKKTKFFFLNKQNFKIRSKHSVQHFLHNQFIF